MSELHSKVEILWLLEEVVIAASFSPAGAANEEDDEEMANVASKKEELEGSFMTVVAGNNYSKMKNRRKRWKTMRLKREVLYDGHTNLGEPDYGSDQQIRMSLQTSGLDDICQGKWNAIAT